MVTVGTPEAVTTEPISADDRARRREAQRLARELDINADVVRRHLLELERKGIIQLTEAAL